ncbi:glycoside hydrolase family 47 protein [Rutstroemia sp. NJR-2017a BBW]|nr:glycoside hydrolase family 47 protein [Rutstroemia sp. NJR-2017a BBW]
MLSKVILAPLLAALPWTTIAVPHGPQLNKRQSYGHSPGPSSSERAAAVKEAFTHAWDGYSKYAFGHDELHPVSNTYSDSRNGWGASAVDAFSTAIIMEIPEIVDQILEFIPTINFSNTSSQISLFETTIRYIGGLLAGYDLLKGPVSNLNSNDTAVDEVLQQAVRLANNLAFAFDTPSGVPSNNLYFNPSRTDGSTNNGIATIGTLVLEWTHLSDLTGNKTYAELSQKGESYLLDPHPKYNEPWPGLVGTNVNLQTGLFEDASGGWGGGDDSFYEYLIKMYVYDTTRFSQYKDRWIAAADSSIKHLASHPSSRPDLTFLAAYNNKTRRFVSEHLACFDGGNFLLGGLVLKNKKYIDFGLALVEGCEDTYNSTLTGIGPEVFNWVENGTLATDPNNPPVPADQAAFYEKAGFYITNGNYILRPEVLESFYYAYRLTGNQKYRDWSWNGFVAINATARTGSGFAELQDVNAPNGGGFFDFQDSFWFAEVLKYAFLIHADDAEYQVGSGGKNEWVFNTEAHPFKVAGPPI